MNRIYVEADKTIELGKQGEYGVTEIFFPLISDTVVILHQRNKDENPYSVTCEIRGDYVVWPVTATDTAHDGGGLCEVQYYTGTTLAKSIVFRTFVHWSVADSPTVTPSADQAWVQTVSAKSAEAVSAAAAAKADKEATAAIAISADYADVVSRLDGLRRKVAAMNNALIQRVKKNSLYTYFQKVNADDKPMFGDYTDECHIHFSDAYMPHMPVGSDGTEGYRPPMTGGFLEVKRGYPNSKYPGMQYFYPYNDNTVSWQIWARPRKYNSAGAVSWGAWYCINGVEESDLAWEVSSDE